MSKDPNVSERMAARKAYIDSILKDWPPMNHDQARIVAGLLYGTEIAQSRRKHPSAYEVERARVAQEREDALRSAKNLAESLTACDVCNLQPDVHHYQKAHGTGFHEWVPGRAEKIMRGVSA